MKHPHWLSRILEGPADADTLAPLFPWAQDMIGCPHDPVYHAEGDPWTHTGMVAAELESAPGWDALSFERREILRLGAWFHDIAKPATTLIEWDEELQRERVRQPGHAPLGAQWAWQGLVDAGYDPLKAREVHALVFWHQRPQHMLKENSCQRRAIRYGHEVITTCWDDLLRLCAADQNGRRVSAGENSLDDLRLVEMYLNEQGESAGADLLKAPWPFASDAARLKALRGGATASPFHAPQEPAGSRVIVLSGLPGSGKNHLLDAQFKGMPSISFDDLREEMKMSHGDNQGRMIQAAFEQARVHLRAGEDFVWNAACLNRRSRQKIIGLALDYDARIEIHSIDVPLGLAKQRNAGRERAIPEKALLTMAGRREPVMCDEAHEIWSHSPGREPQRVGHLPSRLAAPDIATNFGPSS